MRSKSKLSRNEYQVIYERYHVGGWGIGQISRYLGRAKSTVSRALKRDWHPSPLLTLYEKASHAYERSRIRMRLRSRRKRLKTARLRRLVIYLLCRRHCSPEQISGLLSRHGESLSAKAIYNYIKTERQELKLYLRQRGHARRKRVMSRRGMFKSGVPAKQSIHERPERVGPGHWEIDTVLSCRSSKGGVLTLREFESKKRFYFLLSDLRAETVMRHLFPFFQALPPHLRRTITADNGGELSELYKLSKILPGFGVYYCDPYKAYQRGSVENANGELRWYYPKKTDFLTVTPSELNKVQQKINYKPMKCLGWRTPTAVFHQRLMQAA